MELHKTVLLLKRLIKDPELDVQVEIRPEQTEQTLVLHQTELLHHIFLQEREQTRDMVLTFLSQRGPNPLNRCQHHKLKLTEAEADLHPNINQYHHKEGVSYNKWLSLMSAYLLKQSHGSLKCLTNQIEPFLHSTNQMQPFIPDVCLLS